MQRQAIPCVIACSLLLFLAQACKSPTSPSETPLSSPSATVDGGTVTLEAFAYRDSQPSPQPGGSVFVVLRLHASTAALRNSLAVQSATITSTATGEHWSTTAIQSGAPADAGADYVNFVVRGAPAWPVGSSCLVAVSVRSATGAAAMLGNSGVVIQSVS